MTARELILRLKNQRKRIVLAESCTGGALAAALTGIPGASEVFCGSAVTYREATKTAWLNVAPAVLQVHTAVSAATSRAMASGVLQQTHEAHIAIAVTGHFGPGVPAPLDGRVFLAYADREGRTSETAFMLMSVMRADRCQETVDRTLAWLLSLI